MVFNGCLFFIIIVLYFLFIIIIKILWIINCLQVINSNN